MFLLSYSVVETGRVEADSVAVQVRDNDEVGDEGDEEAKHVNGESGIELVRVWADIDMIGTVGMNRES